MEHRKRKTRGFTSIKENAGSLHKKSTFHKHVNLGALMRQKDAVMDVLYSYTSSISDFIHDDMDFTIEEFCDWTGADMEELIQDLTKAVSVR